MNDRTKIYIERQYNEIIRKITGGFIFGEQVDLNNIEMVIVAAYLFGTTEPIPYVFKKGTE
jgi:hypothetical protein